MTKNIRRWLLASLAVAAVGVSGCVLTSAQILAAFDLPNPFTIVSTGSPPVGSVDVDLNSVSDYADNKDKLKGLTDLALLGKFENVSGPAGAVEIWMTADHTTNFTTVGQITGGATKVWGPFEIGATGSVVTINWDDSAALFTTAGKALLLSEVKGDGHFKLYAFGTAGTYNIRVTDGSLVFTLDAGL